MMYRRILSFVLIISCIFIIVIYENKFQSLQNLLILESNNLFSSNHIIADESVNPVWRSFQTPFDDFHVFGILEKTSNQIAMAFYTTNYSKFKPPIKSGISFTIPDSKEVIVGENIQTTINNGVEYFDYKDERYLVIGKLGISNNSPLKNHVVINDTSLLEESYIPLIFDGVDISKVTWLQGKPMESKGVVRWLNISLVLKWIKWATRLVIIFASILAAHFYGIATKESRLERFQIGVRAQDILNRDLIILTLTTFSMILISLTLNKLINMELSIRNFCFSYILIYTSLTVTHIILLEYQITSTGGMVE